MTNVAKATLAAGVILMVLSLLTSTGLAHDPSLPTPLAICGSGLFIGGACLARRMEPASK